LVYENHLSTIWWLRSPWSKQFSDGQYVLGMGKNIETGHLGVCSEAPYFVDDHLYCPRDAMELVQDAALHVSLVPQSLESADGMPTVTAGAWGLDICLGKMSQQIR
jgi:UPF0489 domain